MVVEWHARPVAPKSKVDVVPSWHLPSRLGVVTRTPRLARGFEGEPSDRRQCPVERGEQVCRECPEQPFSIIYFKRSPQLPTIERVQRDLGTTTVGTAGGGVSSSVGIKLVEVLGQCDRRRALPCVANDIARRPNLHRDSAPEGSEGIEGNQGCGAHYTADDHGREVVVGSKCCTELSGIQCTGIDLGDPTPR
jgi:hypothetical protein